MAEGAGSYLCKSRERIGNVTAAREQERRTWERDEGPGNRGETGNARERIRRTRERPEAGNVPDLPGTSRVQAEWQLTSKSNGQSD